MTILIHQSLLQVSNCNRVLGNGRPTCSFCFVVHFISSQSEIKPPEEMFQRISREAEGRAGTHSADNKVAVISVLLIPLGSPSSAALVFVTISAVLLLLLSLLILFCLLLLKERLHDLPHERLVVGLRQVHLQPLRRLLPDLVLSHPVQVGFFQHLTHSGLDLLLNLRVHQLRRLGNPVSGASPKKGQAMYKLCSQ